MKRPDLSDLLLALGLAVALHAIYRWSPVVAQLLAGSALATWGAAIGVLKATKKPTKRSP